MKIFSMYIIKYIQNLKGVKMLSNIQKGLKKGFTMIELIFVIVIIGLGIATAVNVGNSGISAQEVSNSVTSPVRDLMIGRDRSEFCVNRVK